MARLIIVMIAAAMMSSCTATRTPTDIYYWCSGGCFVECTDADFADAVAWSRDKALLMAEYCRDARKQCSHCIDRIEHDGNACGVQQPCGQEYQHGT